MTEHRRELRPRKGRPQADSSLSGRDPADTSASAAVPRPGVRVRGPVTIPRQFRFTESDDVLFDRIAELRGERPTEAMRWFLRTYGPAAVAALKEGRR